MLQRLELLSKQCWQQMLQAHAHMPHQTMFCIAVQIRTGLSRHRQQNSQRCMADAVLHLQVLITGSEATENYIMQIFTPPYLTGKLLSGV